ncbi:MAG: cysteine desulfurase family protein [Acidimicrobiales bacterium]
MRHYLDHASTSPLRAAAFAAMEPWLLDPAGDPSRIHAEGMRARVAVEQAREQVAELLGARSREVIFTSGATESIAAACFGAASRGTHQIFAAVEHSAVRESAARAGDTVVVAVDGLGRIDIDELSAAIGPDTALVHVQWANHEVGTEQPVAEVVALCRERGVLVHVDAAQAAGHVPIAFDALGVDLMSVSAHKMGGPAGTGALLVRRGLRLPPLLLGGDQERARRAGLENVPAIVAFGATCAELLDTLPREADDARALTDAITLVATAIPDVLQLGDPVDRVPHLVCFAIGGVEPQAVLLGLDRAGIAAHSGSACASESLEPSPVLQAMGVDAHRSLRISVGHTTTAADIDALAGALPRIVADLRALATP